jgi:gamma-glutamylputrescine oxidase
MARVEHVASYYAATANTAPPWRRLEGTEVADVCVIGGGFTGVSTALHLAERGLQVVLLEAARIGWGASGRNGGEVFNGQRRSQDQLEEWFGPETAKQLWDFGLEAVDLVTGRIRNHRINCDLKPGVLTVAAKPSHADYLQETEERLRRDYGYHRARLLSREETADMIGTDRYCGGLLDVGCWHLHPLNYVLGLATAATAAGVQIYEQSRAESYAQGDTILVRTERGEVRAKFLVLAGDTYLGDLEPRIAAYTMPINNFILATEPFTETAARALNPLDVAVADTKFVINYWRFSADRRLLFGGGETYSPKFPGDIRSFVRKYLLKIYPQLKDVRIDYGWGGAVGITLRRLPHFGRLAPNVIFAHGWSGQGIAMGTLAGRVIAEAIGGIAERFDVLANLPAHRFPGGRWLRHPALVLGMLWFSLRDRL